MQNQLGQRLFRQTRQVVGQSLKTAVLGIATDDASSTEPAVLIAFETNPCSPAADNLESLEVLLVPRPSLGRRHINAADDEFLNLL